MPQQLPVKRINILSFLKLCLIGNSVSFVVVWILLSIPAMVGAPIVKWEDEYITGVMTVVAGPVVVAALGLVFSVVQALFAGIGLFLYSRFAKISITFLADD
ncbi:MAG: hypothetical protein V4628_14305 [Pseudomonadota bacterium]